MLYRNKPSYNVISWTFYLLHIYIYIYGKPKALGFSFRRTVHGQITSSQPPIKRFSSDLTTRKRFCPMPDLTWFNRNVIASANHPKMYKYTKDVYDTNN